MTEKVREKFMVIFCTNRRIFVHKMGHENLNQIRGVSELQTEGSKTPLQRGQLFIKVEIFSRENQKHPFPPTDVFNSSGFGQH